MRKLYKHAWQLLAFAIIASTASAEIVVLKPGILVMEVTLTDDGGSQETVDGVYGWAHSVGTGFSASAYDWDSNSVKLSVEGDQWYRRYVWVYGPWGRLDIYHDEAAHVGIGETVMDSYAYTTAHAIADITVIGGTVGRVEMFVSASEGQERYYGQRYQDLNAQSGQIWMPMVTDSAVSVRIYAHLQTTDGISLSRSLSETVDMSGGSVTIPFTFDLSDATASTLQGTASIPAPFDSYLSSHWLRAYQGHWRYKSLSENATFEFADLSGGTAYTYGDTYMKSPYYRLAHPYVNVSIPTGGVATRDYVVPSMGVAHGSLMVGGFKSNSDLYRSELRLAGISGTATASMFGYGQDYSSNAQLDVALPAGAWRNERYSVRFRDTSTPETYLDSEVRTTIYNQASWLLANDAAVDLSPIPVTTLQTDLIFDVFEPPGVTDEYMIGSPYLYGYSYQYNEQGQTQAEVRLDAWGTGQKQTTSILRVVAEPGTYQVNPRAYVYEPGNPTPSNTDFPSFELTMEANDTPVCDSFDPTLPQCPVVVEMAGGDVVLTFDQVDEAGLTTVTSSPVGPEPPQNFGVYDPDNQDGAPATYYYIQSSATFSGTVEVCFQYDDSGFASSTSQEDALRIAHYITATNEWEILTTTSINTVTNTICAETTSFSPFALVLPLTTNGAPIADAGADQSFTCLLPDEQVLVALDGSGSSDPDGDALEYQWSENGTLLATGVSPTTAMSAGTHVVSLEVSDGSATSDPDTVTISLLADVEPPTLSLLGNNPAVLECGQLYVEAGATAFDECSGDLSTDVRIDGNVDSGMTGTYQIRYQVRDDAGLSATAERTVEVSDTAAPDVVMSEPEVLWPPNHTYRAYSLADCASLEADICEPALDINSAGRILSIYSDEPENGVGNGSTMNDIIIDGYSHFRVRAERQGGGNGRVYGVTFVVADSAGNISAPETCYIHVPRCISSRCQPAQDDGAAYVVNATNQ